MHESLHALVVEDDEGTCLFFAHTLEHIGLKVTRAASGEEALNYLRDTSYQLVLSDYILTGQVTGLDVLTAVRWRWPRTPFILISGQAKLETAIEAVHYKADNFLLKPVRAPELIQAVEQCVDPTRIHRDQPNGQAIFQSGPFYIDRLKHIAMVNGEKLHLTPREFKLLIFLLENSHRVVTPMELVRVARDYSIHDTYEARQIIKWYIHRLRKKIEPETGKTSLIHSIRGVGYRLVLDEMQGLQT